MAQEISFNELKKAAAPEGRGLCGNMMEQSRAANVKVTFALTLIHFIGDFYGSFINPLLPALVEKLTLTLTQVGLLGGISRLLAFVVQPPVGYLADHYRTRFFVLGGPLLAIIFIPLVGIAPSFLILLSFMCLGSIGSSMYHPTAAGMVSTYGGKHFGFSMSIFIMGGTLAFGAGPVFITYFVTSYGLSASPLTMIFGLLVTVLLFKIVPRPRGEQLKKFGFVGLIRDALGTVWKSILVIWVVRVLQAFVSQSFLIFIPILCATEGYSLIAIGTIVSLYTVAGALGGLLAGYLVDRIGYKPVFYGALGLTTPSLYVLLSVPGNWIYATACLAGFAAMATTPVGVAMAQELVPQARSTASSLMMGLAFGSGGMLTALTGKLADMFAIRPVLSVLAIIPILTISLIFLVPEIRTAARKPQP